MIMQDPTHIDIRVKEFLKTFESKMNDMTSDEFKVSELLKIIRGHSVCLDFWAFLFYCSFDLHIV